MEIIKILITNWTDQGIAIQKKKSETIQEILINKGIKAPNDFLELYKEVNGMINLFPNDYDREGFLFYPIEELISMETMFPNTVKEDLKNIVIFADYMLKCWWYGFRMMHDGTYQIGIITDSETFRSITNSLNHFIYLYLNDSELIY